MNPEKMSYAGTFRDSWKRMTKCPASLMAKKCPRKIQTKKFANNATSSALGQKRTFFIHLYMSTSQLQAAENSTYAKLEHFECQLSVSHLAVVAILAGTAAEERAVV